MAVDYRISDTTQFLMGGWALFWDAVSFIPWVGGLISFVFGWGGLLLWFKFLGIGLFEAASAKRGAEDSPNRVQNFVAKRLAAWFVGMFGEAVTALFGLSGFYPGFCITVILMVRSLRKEDEQATAQQEARAKAEAEQERRERQQIAAVRPRMDDMVTSPA